MIVLKTLFVVTQLALIFYFVFPWILKILRNGQNMLSSQGNQEADYAVIVTAYKNIEVIRGFLSSVKGMDYKNFVVYIVADNCGDFVLGDIGSNIVILRPPEPLHDNVKSHRYAVENFIRPHQRITIIDSDNVLHSQYLIELNHVFASGFLAVQGVRNARNYDTDLAKLDALNDLYYRYIDRKLLFEAGSSAALSGSGMAFDAKLYKECTDSYSLTGAGFDKFLQNEIVSKGYRIALADKAIVLDQKISRSDELVKQRARWIRTWFKSLRSSLSLLIRAVKSGNRNAFLFSIAVLRPPLFIMLASAISFFFLNLFLIPLMNIPLGFSAIAAAFCFLHSLKVMNASQSLYGAINKAPKFFYLQLKAFAKIRVADKISVATLHEIPFEETSEAIHSQ